MTEKSPALLYAPCSLLFAHPPRRSSRRKSHRIGYQSAGSSGENTSRHFARDCVNWATSKDRTSSLSGDLRKEGPIRSPKLG